MDLMDYRRKIIANSPHLSSASGAVATFSDGADLPLKSLNVNVEPVQSGSGDPSPTNIRPISGWTGMQLNANGTVISISWQTEAGTVYGGKLDVLTGVMTVDKGCDTFDGSSDETWNILSSDKQRISFRGWLSNAKKETATSITDMMTNSIPLSTTSENAFNNDKITCRGTAYQSVYVYIFVPPSEFNTIEQLRAYLADQPWQVVYPLATPFEIQLTPHQVRSLYGNNTIFADTGNVALEYWAHP